MHGPAVIYRCVSTVLICGLSVLSCRPEGEGENPAVKHAAPAGRADGHRTPVATEKPQRTDFKRTVRWWGRCEALTVTVVAFTAGRVEEFRVSDGAVVAAGELLVRLGGPRAEAKTAEFEAGVATAQEAAALAKQRFEREQQALAEQLGTAGAQAAALAELKQAEAALAASVRARAVHRAALAITAPRAGVFTRRRVEIGQDVREGDVIAEIVDRGALRIEAHTFCEGERSIEGLTVQVKRPQGVMVEARVVLVYPARAPDGSLRFRAEGPRLAHALTPGEPVQGQIILEVRKDCLSLPVQAVVRDEKGSPFVFVVSKAAYVKRRVTTGLEEEGRIEIRSGITSAEEIVTTGAYQLFHREFRSIYREED
jgi:Cu(I)/Ag(I) efflux system membrane fusion protein